MSWSYSWRPYVSVAERRRQAALRLKQLEKKSGRAATPVQATGRDPAKSFWGKAWCRHVEDLGDYENRLPRGRTYLRNGSVIDLQILPGEVKALVSGSEIYAIKVQIETLEKARWQRLKSACANSVDSLFDLLQGKFDEGVMRRLTDPREGLFPREKEIKMRCSCPDSAYLCKHLAAVLYGVGTRLDSAPELLFKLRDVDHLELIKTALAADNLDHAFQGSESSGLEGSNLEELFGIELDSTANSVSNSTPAKSPKGRPRAARTKAAASSPSLKKAGATKSGAPAPARKMSRSSPKAAKTGSAKSNRAVPASSHARKQKKL